MHLRLKKTFGFKNRTSVKHSSQRHRRSDRTLRDQRSTSSSNDKEQRIPHSRIPTQLKTYVEESFVLHANVSSKYAVNVSRVIPSLFTRVLNHALVEKKYCVLKKYGDPRKTRTSRMTRVQPVEAVASASTKWSRGCARYGIERTDAGETQGGPLHPRVKLTRGVDLSRRRVEAGSGRDTAVL